MIFYSVFLQYFYLSLDKQQFLQSPLHSILSSMDGKGKIYIMYIITNHLASSTDEQKRPSWIEFYLTAGGPTKFSTTK